MTPPELIEYVQADYPKEAFAQGLEAEVLAQLDIDESGLVTKVEILEPAGHGFDEAATEAMYKFVFAPAMKDDVPIPSRVVYRYTFFIEQQALEPEEQAPLLSSLTGTVSDMDGNGIPDATVMLAFISPAAADADEDAQQGQASGSSEPVSTDSNGKFAFEELQPGTYQLDIAAPGYKPFSTAEELVEGESKEVIYRLEMETSAYETVIRGRRPPREVTRREITRREITRIPGTGGDALRSVQTMPGMARAPGLSGALIVRGSSPGDSRYFFDSISVPLLYHFGGLTSIINSDLLERIDFYPGNYSVRYGDATGGIVDVYPRSPQTDRYHAYVDADFWDIGVLAEGPIGDDWSLAISGRRSYIDWILGAVLPDTEGFSFTVAPRYYDYQVVADYHPDSRDNLRLFAFGSDDRLVFVFGEDVGDNPNFGGGVNFALFFHQVQAKWDHKLTKTVSNEANVGVAYTHTDASAGQDMRFALDNVPIFIRDELIIDPKENFVLRTGVDAVAGWVQWEARFPDRIGIGGEGEQFDPLNANEQYMERSEDLWYFLPAAYGEFEFTSIPDLRIINGLRLSYHPLMEKLAIDPRLAVRYQLFKPTTLKGGVGIFHQTPGDAESDDEFGNPDLDYIRAIHYSLGVEHNLTEVIEVNLEGFYKDLTNLVVSSTELVARDGEMVPERYNNDGTGHVYGLELMVKHQPTERFFGWIAYTLMTSRRVDHPGEKERLFDYDQTHILTVVASAVLGRGWEAGIRFRLVTGNPLTPVVDSIYDADSDIYWPIYGETNSDRLPTFHQLDVRIDKRWEFKHLKFGVYIDVQNIYNQQNPEGYQHNYDYTQRQYFTGVPIVPSLGLKLEY